MFLVGRRESGTGSVVFPPNEDRTCNDLNYSDVSANYNGGKFI